MQYLQWNGEAPLSARERGRSEKQGVQGIRFGFGKRKPSEGRAKKWCAVQVSNLRPLPCEGNALPLS